MLTPFTAGRVGGVALRTLSKPATISRLATSASPFSTTARSSRTLVRSALSASPKTTSSPLVRNAFIRRVHQGEPLPAVPPEAAANTSRRLLTAGLIFGGTLIGMNVMFNRETRTDGGMPLFEREYLNDTFMHTGLGIGIIGFSARAMVRNGFVYRIMATNPWAVALGGLALSFGTMIGTRATDPDK